MGAIIAGDDFTEFDRTVTFAPGMTRVTIAVSSTEDSVDENDEKLTVMLRNPTGGARIGSDDEAEVIIQDDDGKLLGVTIVKLIPFYEVKFFVLFLHIQLSLCNLTRHRTVQQKEMM